MNFLQLGEAVRRSGGILHGECKEWTDVEFPTLHRGMEFVAVMGWVDVARLRDTVTDHRDPVVFQIPNEAVAYWGTDEHIVQYLGE